MGERKVLNVCCRHLECGRASMLPCELLEGRNTEPAYSVFYVRRGQIIWSVMVCFCLAPSPAHLKR